MQINRRELLKAAGAVVAEVVIRFPLKISTDLAESKKPTYANLAELARGRRAICVSSECYASSSGGILYTHFQNYRITNNAVILLDKKRELGVLASITNSHDKIYYHPLFNRLASTCSFPLESEDREERKSLEALYIRNADSILMPDSSIEERLTASGMRDIRKVCLDTTLTRKHDIALDINSGKVYVFSPYGFVRSVDLNS